MASARSPVLRSELRPQRKVIVIIDLIIYDL